MLSAERLQWKCINETREGLVKNVIGRSNGCLMWFVGGWIEKTLIIIVGLGINLGFVSSGVGLNEYVNDLPYFREPF